MKSDIPRLAEVSTDSFDASPTTARVRRILHGLTPVGSNPTSSPNAPPHWRRGHSIPHNRRTTIPDQRTPGLRSSNHSGSTALMMDTIGPPLRTRRRTRRTCTPAWSGARHPSVGYGPGEPAVAHHPYHVQGLHHHSARRLGYRRRCLVMMVVPTGWNDRCCRERSDFIPPERTAWLHQPP